MKFPEGLGSNRKGGPVLEVDKGATKYHFGA